MEQEELELHTPQTDLQHLVEQLDFHKDLVLAELKVVLVEEALAVGLHMGLEHQMDHDLVEDHLVNQVVEHHRDLGRQMDRRLVVVVVVPD